LIEHDLFGKPLRTFPDNALVLTGSRAARASRRLNPQTKTPPFAAGQVWED
jgi:hypothetical protein